MASCSKQINDDKSALSTFDVVVLGTCVAESACISRSLIKNNAVNNRAYSCGLTYGGNGASQAAIVALMGYSVALISRVCYDEISQNCLNDLHRYGVNTAHVVPCQYCDNALDENPCTCGAKAEPVVGNGHLMVDDIIRAKELIQHAHVVIVNSDIGVAAALKVLKMCNNKVSIFYASHSPSRHTEALFKLAMFVVFIGERIFSMTLYQRLSRMDRNAVIENVTGSDVPSSLMIRLLQLGTSNIITLFTADHYGFAGNGLKGNPDCITREIKWKPIDFEARKCTCDTLAWPSNEYVASLAVVLVHCRKNEINMNLEDIVGYSRSLNAECNKMRNLLKDKRLHQNVDVCLRSQLPKREYKTFHISSI